LWWSRSSEIKRSLHGWPGAGLWEGNMSGMLSTNQSHYSEITTEFTMPYGTEGSHIEISIYADSWFANQTEESLFNLELQHPCYGELGETTSNIQYNHGRRSARVAHLTYDFNEVPSHGCIPNPTPVIGTTTELGEPFEIKISMHQNSPFDDIDFSLTANIIENTPPVAILTAKNWTMAHEIVELSACESYDPDGGNGSQDELEFEWDIPEEQISSIVEQNQGECTMKVKHESAGMYEYGVWVIDSWGRASKETVDLHVESFPPNGTTFASEFEDANDFDFSRDWSFRYDKFSPTMRVQNKYVVDGGIDYSFKVGIRYNFQVAQSGNVMIFNSVEEGLDYWNAAIQYSTSDINVEVLFRPELVLEFAFCNFDKNDCTSDEIPMGLPTLYPVYDGQPSFTIGQHSIYFWDEYIPIMSNDIVSTNQLIIDTSQSVDISSIDLWPIVQYLFSIPDLRLEYQDYNDLYDVATSIDVAITIPLRYSLDVELLVWNNLDLIHYSQTSSGDIYDIEYSQISSSIGVDSGFTFDSSIALGEQSIIVIAFLESNARLSVTGEVTVMFEVKVKGDYTFDGPGELLDSEKHFSETLKSDRVTIYRQSEPQIQYGYSWMQHNPANVWKSPIEQSDNDDQSENVEQSDNDDQSENVEQSSSSSSEVEIITWSGIVIGIIVALIGLLIVRRKRGSDSDDWFEEDNEIYQQMTQTTQTFTKENAGPTVAAHANPTHVGSWEDLPDGEWLENDEEGIHWYLANDGTHWHSTDDGYRVWDES
jgi:hypothetical protein